jgi:hypothetical protein
MFDTQQYLIQKYTTKKFNVHIQECVKIVICFHKSRKMFECWELLDVDTQFKAGENTLPFPIMGMVTQNQRDINKTMSQVQLLCN